MWRAGVVVVVVVDVFFYFSSGALNAHSTVL